MIFFTIARDHPRGGAGIVRQMPYLSPQLSPGRGGGGGGGWGISLIGALPFVIDRKLARTYTE